MAYNNNPLYSYKNLNASGQVLAGQGQLGGIFVSAAAAVPTIKVWDNTTGSGPVLVDTFTPVAGTWYPMPFAATAGLFVTITGTVVCTVAFN